MRLLIGLLAILVIVAIYFLPTIIAFKRKYKNRMSVFIIDLFLGWTLVGWVIALALSFINDIDENKKQSDKAVKLIGILGVLIFAIFAIIAFIGYKKHYEEKNSIDIPEDIYDLTTDKSNSPEKENSVDLLFQPYKLSEMSDQEVKEVFKDLYFLDVRLACAKGANVNAISKHGKSVLMYASQYCKDPDVIDLLIKNGANVRLKDETGKTALMYASAYNENPEIIEMLIIHGSYINEGEEANDRALVLAAANNNNPEVIETLIAKGAYEFDIDDALISSCSYNKSIEVIATLMKHLDKANKKIYINNKETLLMRASAKNDNPKVIEFLIEKGLDLKAKDSEGRTALMYASAYNKNPEIVSVLLKKGDDVNVTDNKGKTPLIYASKQNSNPDVVIALLQNKANINAVDEHGMNALMASYHRYSWLEGKDAENIRKILVENGIDINAKDKEGKTALMYACENAKDISMIDKMLENGADINAKDKKGYSVYDYARRNKNIMFSKIKAVLDKYQK